MQLKDKFLDMKQKLKEKLATLEAVCTTADCWTSQRLSFIGVTVHWLEMSQTTVLERRGSLAIRELSGRHTYDVIAKTLESIYNEFNIMEKISCTVTDSGANYLRPWRKLVNQNHNQLRLIMVTVDQKTTLIWYYMK